MKKVSLYCQVGSSLDMAQFSIDGALAHSGLHRDDIELIFICWKTSDTVYQWLENNNFKWVDMEYDEGKGFLWNLYKGWNLGYEEGFKYADYVCPIATDHAFYDNWLANLLKHGRNNRIVNCKLIEPGTCYTLHSVANFGPTVYGEINYRAFRDIAGQLYKYGEDILVVDGATYGHRLDAMPFLCPRDVWDRFGPMNQDLNAHGITGDTDFFDRCMAGGVQITKALDSVSYHCGGLETQRNNAKGVYT